MIPILQTKFKEGEGNCLPACLASVLEVPLDSVPEIYYLYDDEEWWTRLNNWSIREHELQLVTVDSASFTPAGYHLIVGKSIRGNYHAIVGYQGKPVHDPLFSNGQITELSDVQYIIFVSTLL